VDNVNVPTDADLNTRSFGDVDSRVRPLYPGEASYEGYEITRRAGPLVLVRIEPVVDHVDMRKRHLARPLVGRDRHVVHVREVTIESRELLVTVVVESVDERDLRDQSGDRERHG